MSARTTQTRCLLRLLANAMPALPIPTEMGRAQHVSQASTRMRQGMPRAAIVPQVNTQRRLVTHLMSVKGVPKTPTHLRRATRKQTAFATRARRAQTAETV